MFTLNDLIDIAVKMEKNGEAVYLKSMQKVAAEELRSLLRWMAEEEADHRQWFRDRKDKWRSDSGETDLQVMLPDILKEMMGEKSLSLDDVDFSRIRSATTMLETFIEFETDTILFYEFLEAFIEDGQAEQGLIRIIREENRHVAKLREMIQAIDDQVIPEETISF